MISRFDTAEDHVTQTGRNLATASPVLWPYSYM